MAITSLSSFKKLGVKKETNTQTLTLQNTNYTFLNVTGVGRVEFFRMSTVNNGAAFTISVTVDGNNIISANIVSSSSSAYYYPTFFSPNASTTANTITFYFYKSLKVDIQTSNGAGATATFDSIYNLEQ